MAKWIDLTAGDCLAEPPPAGTECDAGLTAYTGLPAVSGRYTVSYLID